VLAFGSYSRDFLKPLHLNLPVYPVKGYSLTIPIVQPEFAPQSTVLDETYKIALRVLISGFVSVEWRNSVVSIWV
jgi:D-amino-acid dehydrogenase